MESEFLQRRLKKYRKERNFNPSKYLQEKQHVFLSYLKEYGLDSTIVALSGGIDSAVVYAMLQYFKDNDSENILKHVQGICLPAKSLEKGASNQNELTIKVKELFSKYGQEYLEFDISKSVLTLNEELQNQIPNLPTEDAWALGQVVSYIRTPIYYYLSSLMYANGYKSVVVGTTNKDEGAYLGYFGKASDGMVDIQLISDLHKSEVYQVAEYLGVPTSIIKAVPTGDMYDSRTDEEVFGTTYDFVELYLNVLENKYNENYDSNDIMSAYNEFLELSEKVNAIHNYNKHKYLGHSPAVHMDVIYGTEKIIGGWKYFNYKAKTRLKETDYETMKLSKEELKEIENSLNDKILNENNILTYPINSNKVEDGEVNHIKDFISEEAKDILINKLSENILIPVGKHGMKSEVIKTVDDIGSYRASMYCEDLADILTKHLNKITDNLNSLDLKSKIIESMDSEYDFEYIGINPLFRFIKYTKNGYLVPHYDLPYETENEITLFSLVIYLRNDGTSTRFIKDSYRDIPYNLRDLSDLPYKLQDKNNVLLEIGDNDSSTNINKDGIIFDHILLHDSEQCVKNDKIIIRTDLMFKKIKK